MGYKYISLILSFIIIFISTSIVYAQSFGDYRSTQDGNWNSEETWEIYNGASWENANTAPEGEADQIIEITNTVSIASATVQIAGDIIVSGSGELTTNGGTLVFEDGSVYQHDRDEGRVPDASWRNGSTIFLTGLISDTPDNLNQAFYNITWNNPGQISNLSLGLGTVTIGGTIRVIDTGGARFRLTNSGVGDGETITINGDLLVDGGAFETTGSGDLATYSVIVNGDVIVNDGTTFATSRGSGGRVTWTLFGDFMVNGDAELRDANQENSSRIIFAGNTSQTISISPETDYNGTINYSVSSGANVTIRSGSTFHYEDDFLLDGSLHVAGEIIARDTLNVNEGTLVISDGGTYNHAYDAGVVPNATWENGSTIKFTGLETNGPANGNQDFYNVIINTPDNVVNNDLGMRDNTIYGDIEVIDTGMARLYLYQPDAFDTLNIEIMGDITMEKGAFSTNGTGNGGSEINIHHYGNITVNGGNFSISRGSGPFVNWYLYEGGITFKSGETQNSNPRSGSAFIFKGQDTVQYLSVSETFDVNYLPIVVDSAAFLDIGTSNLSESGDHFTVKAGVTISSASPAAFSISEGGNLELGGSNQNQLSLSNKAHYVINGTQPQTTGFALPLEVSALTIDNSAGVSLSRMVTISEELNLLNGVLDNSVGLNLSEDAKLNIQNGSLTVPVDLEDVFPIPNPPYQVGDTLNYNGSFQYAEIGDTYADVWTINGISDSSWEIVGDAADEDGKAFAFNIIYGEGDWSSSQAINESINVVEGERYKASIYLKAYEVGRLAKFYVGMPESGNFERVRGNSTPELFLENEWAEYSFNFTATAEHEEHGLRMGVELNSVVNDSSAIFIDNATLIKQEQEALSNEEISNKPKEFFLSQNYPNPFNPSTNINFSLPKASDVTLEVFDVTGRRVALLVNNHKPAGNYKVKWDAIEAATGIYIYRLTAGDISISKKLFLIK